MPPGRPSNQSHQTHQNAQGSSQAGLNSANHSSVYPIDTVVDVADQLGIPNLKPQIASALASDIEYRIRFVAQVSFMSSSEGGSANGWIRGSKKE